MERIIDLCLQYINEHIEDELSVDEISKKMGYSRHHFSRAFSHYVGVSIRDYMIEKRLLQAAKDLINGERIIDVAVKYRYETHSGFSKAFKRKFSYSPNLLIAMKLTERILTSEGGTAMTHADLFNELVDTIVGGISTEQMALLENAYRFAVKVHLGKKRYSGEDYVTHPLNVAIILAQMEVPIETVILGLLHDCHDADVCMTIQDIRFEFGDYYDNRIKRMMALNLSCDLLNEVNLERDEDIVLVKLADRLHNMRTIKFLDQSRWLEKANETVAIFSPLAQRFGLLELKVKLDNLSLQNL